jgi:CubicO group peptidase (beta-lactamase class C family)
MAAVTAAPIAASIRAAFDENFRTRGEAGASVSVWRGGREIALFAAGTADRQGSVTWTESTLVLCWSATKGPSAACVLHALEHAGLTPDDRVSRVWPEFAAAGKQDTTLGQVLSHAAGVPGLAELHASATDHEAVAAALAAAPPAWTPGSAHGYHPRTAGYLWDELVRRLTGMPLGKYWRSVFGDPMGLDFWIGLPESELPRVAEMLPARRADPPPESAALYSDLARPGSLSRLAFHTPRDLQSIASMNTRAARLASLPAIGGIGTASALAQFYALLAGDGMWDGRRYFEPATLEWMRRPRVSGPDRILHSDTAFAAGFMMDPVNAAGAKTRAHFGPGHHSFGHPGAGGSQAFADPDQGIGFAYLMNQMELGAFPNPRATALVTALYAALEP